MENRKESIMGTQPINKLLPAPFLPNYTEHAGTGAV